MTTQVRDDGGSEHAGSCEGGGQCLGLRGSLEVESARFSDGLHAGVRMIPGSKHEQQVDIGAISQGGKACGQRELGGGWETRSGSVIFEATHVKSW